MIKTIIFLVSFSLINLVYAEVSYQQPIKITQGSSQAYQGNWASTSAQTPAVDIQTTDPVTLSNCNIKGPGLLIKTVPGAHLTLKNCVISGTNPQLENYSRPRVLDGTFNYLVVEHNRFDHTAGMSIWNMQRGKADSVPSSSNATIQVRYNIVNNLDGRLENGGVSDSYIPSAPGKSRVHDDHFHVNFVSVVGFLSDPNIEIAWNQIINQPGQSAMEDVILIMSSSGASTQQPILIHDNYIQGVYGGAPTTTFHYGGSGINSGDYLARLKDPQYVSSFVHTFNNQIVGSQAWGLVLPAGHDITIENNRVVRSGLLPSMTAMPYSTSGLMMVDLYKLEPKSSTPVNYNNKIVNNVIAYVTAKKTRFDYEFYGAPGKPNLQCVGKVRSRVDKCCQVEQTTVRTGANITCAPNENYKFNSLITLTDEQAEWTRWQQKLATNKISMGP